MSDGLKHDIFLTQEAIDIELAELNAAFSDLDRLEELLHDFGVRIEKHVVTRYL